MRSKSIPINDIKPPIRITVQTRNQLLQVLRGAHHVRDALEIYFDGMESVYYVCAMNDYNEGLRKLVLSRAAGLLKKTTPKNFNEGIKDNHKFPRDIFMELAV